MRNITKSIASALRNNVLKSNGNTVCDGNSVRLHGNEIGLFCCASAVLFKLASLLFRK